MKLGLTWKMLSRVGVALVLPVTSHAAESAAKTWKLSDEGINYLMAGDVAESAGLKERFGGRKRFGVENWTTPEQVFTWPVWSSGAGESELSIQLNLPQGTRLNISSRQETVERVAVGGWRRVDTRLKLGQGEDHIRIALAEPIKSGALLSVEVVTAKHLPEHTRRLADLKEQRGDVAWFQNAGFGLMFQWGNWGYPQTGDRKQPWQRVYEEFDIEAFADKMKQINPGYIIWSITWWDSRYSAPLASVEKITGSKDFTLEYDFLGKLADALHKRNIPLFLYYHPGASHDGFWKKVWLGQDQRQHFEDMNVVIWTEIGTRLGDKLAGWFIDDGTVQYYPMDFHRCKQALRAGNPRRLTTFNPWKFPNVSPFDDMSMGESHAPGRVQDGVFIDGPTAGMLPHTMFIFDGPNWGLHKKDTVINSPKGDASYWQRQVDKAKTGKHPLSFCILMYEDGTLGEKTEAILKALKR